MCSPSRKYALGVILLQLATGLPAIIQVDKNSSPRLLSDYLRAMQASRIITRFDPRCSGWSPTGDADPFSNGRVLEGLLRLGLRCTEDDRNARLPVADIQLALHDLSTPGGGHTQYFSREENMQPFGDEARVCCICGEAPRAVTFLPCRHSIACNFCFRKLEGGPSGGSGHGKLARHGRGIDGGRSSSSGKTWGPPLARPGAGGGPAFPEGSSPPPAQVPGGGRVPTFGLGPATDAAAVSARPPPPVASSARISAFRSAAAAAAAHGGGSGDDPDGDASSAGHAALALVTPWSPDLGGGGETSGRQGWNTSAGPSLAMGAPPAGVGAAPAPAPSTVSAPFPCPACRCEVAEWMPMAAPLLGSFGGHRDVGQASNSRSASARYLAGGPSWASPGALSRGVAAGGNDPGGQDGSSQSEGPTSRSSITSQALQQLAASAAASGAGTHRRLSVGSGRSSGRGTFGEEYSLETWLQQQLPPTLQPAEGSAGHRAGRRGSGGSSSSIASIAAFHGPGLGPWPAMLPPPSPTVAGQVAQVIDHSALDSNSPWAGQAINI